MNFTKEEQNRIKQTFKTTMELTVFLRDELRLPATVAKSLAWQFFTQEDAEQKSEVEVYFTENVA